MKPITRFQKFMSLVLITAFLFLAPSNLNAAQVTATANGATSCLATGAAITKITIANANASAVTVTITDAPSTTTTFSVGAYTNTTLQTATYIQTYTNTLAIVESRTNVVQYRTNVLVAATTPSYKVLQTMVVPTGQTYTYIPSVPILAFNGILVNHSVATVTTTIDYAPIK